MNPLYVDVFEPPEAINYLQPVVEGGVVVAPLNSGGQADYFWVDVMQNKRQWERKQIGEALSDLNSVEEQINRELATCDEMTLVVENPWLATPDGVQCFKKSGWALRHDHEFRHQPALAARYEAFKQGLRHAGVIVVETMSYDHTMAALVAAYRSSNSAEHTTLRRYITPHIEPFSPNLQIENLCRLKEARCGPVTAEAFIKQYGTVYGAVTASWVSSVNSVGRAATKNLWGAVGRELPK